MTDLITIPNWSTFQHYKNRDPIWIRNYTSLLHNQDYLDLTGHERAVLHGLWLAYASSHAQLRLDTRSLTRQLSLRVASAQLEALNHAGFIEVSASSPLPRTREGARERRREVITPPPPSLGANGDGGDGGFTYQHLLRDMPQ